MNDTAPTAPAPAQVHHVKTMHLLAGNLAEQALRPLADLATLFEAFDHYRPLFRSLQARAPFQLRLFPSLAELRAEFERVLAAADLPHATYQRAHMKASTANDGHAVEGVPAFYIASKTWWSPLWRYVAATDFGFEVASSWHWLPDCKLSSLQQRELWDECAREAAQADAVLLFTSPDDELRGCLIEAGAALGAGKPVFHIGACRQIEPTATSDVSFRQHENWHSVTSFHAALDIWRDRYAHTTFAGFDPVATINAR